MFNQNNPYLKKEKKKNEIVLLESDCISVCFIFTPLIFTCQDVAQNMAQPVEP